MADLDLLSTTLAGRYRIDREIGQGGMATVYLAHDIRHDRDVAVKVLRPDLAFMLGAERFLREIQIAARLNHPNILGVIDSGSFKATDGTAQEIPYYVMPYVAGESLRERLQRDKQLPLEDALRIAREVADALGAAHEHGIVHRDIKPENILLSGGHAVVADFGVARAIDTAGGTKLTESGMAIGTPSYMSPEQSLGQPVDSRSDIYALGCVLYESLVGEPPYTGPTAQAIIARRLSEPLPRVRVVREAVPPAVELAISKALARAAADRFTTTGAFVAALTADAPAAPRRAPRLTRGRLAAAALVLAALATGAWLKWRGPAVSAAASSIAVLPFSSNPDDTALTRLGQSLVFTISSGLDGANGIHTIDPRAFLGKVPTGRGGNWVQEEKARGRSLGAGSVLEGSLRPIGDEVVLDVWLRATDTTTEPLAVVHVRGMPDSIAALTDSVTWQVLHQIWHHGTVPSPSLAAITTHSVPALNAFLDGERLSIAGRWTEAVEAFDAAVKADSTFWLAAWRHNESQQWIPGEPDIDTAMTRRYEAHVASFGDRDRALIEAEKTSDTEPYAAHLARFHAIADRYPSDWAAIWPYADHLVHGGPIIGYTSADARAALERTVDLNPRLWNAWGHLLSMSLGQDSPLADRAVRALTTLGPFPRFPGAAQDSTLAVRVAQASYGHVPDRLLDTLATALLASNRLPERIGGSLYLAIFGFPAAQVALNERLLDRDRGGQFTAPVWQTTAYAWALRGAWDSALTALDAYAVASHGQASNIGLYRFTVAGAWLGGLPIASVEARRPAAARAADSAQGKGAAQERARLAWSDAILAVLRSDQRALATARAALRNSGAPDRGATDRSLGAFANLLAGHKREAAESLAVLDIGPSESAILDAHDGFVRSVSHLEAAKLMLELGDTARAERELTWHEQDSPAPGTWLFAPEAYLQLARIADAKGRTSDSRASYRQFLQRYDLPVPALQPQVDEAKAALRRLS